VDVVNARKHEKSFSPFINNYTETKKKISEIFWRRVFDFLDFQKSKKVSPSSKDPSKNLFRLIPSYI